jgi:5-methylcytosine-specific restriction protein A
MIYDSEVNIDENLWIDILQNKNITTQKVLDILIYILKQPGQESSGKEIVKALNYTHHAPLNNTIPSFSKRVINKYNFVKIPSRDDGTQRYWHIPFLGRKEKDRFLWILRPELKDALTKLFNNT